MNFRRPHLSRRFPSAPPRALTWTLPRTLAWAAFLGAGLGFAAPPPLLAQQSAEQSLESRATESRMSGAPAAADRDFLFHAPRVTLTLRAGPFAYRANGQFYDVAIRDFTIERSDFRNLDLGVEAALAIGDRMDLTLALDGGRVRLEHESRDWEEIDGTPIFQTTQLRTGPVAQIGLRGYLLPRGEQLSTFAWVPTRFAPFIGGGVGYMMEYEVRQWGDFPYEDDEGFWIDWDDLSTTGNARVLYASAGGDLSIRRNLALTLEGRYQWAEDRLSNSYREFTEPLDLAGLRLTAGLSIRF